MNTERPEELEIDARFPSGPWTGYWLQRAHPGRNMMELRLIFRNGTVTGEGREAHTDWRVLGEVPGGSLVECTLHTGRTHQIRVHLKYLGNPVLGDELYGQRGNFSSRGNKIMTFFAKRWGF